MACNTFLDQCACIDSLIGLLSPASGSYTLEIYSRFTNRRRTFTQVVASGDNFVLPMDLNSDAIYELTIKQGNTVISIDGENKWYLKTLSCPDAESGTITASPNSFEYVLEDQTTDIDLTDVVVTTDSGDITINAAMIVDYKVNVYRTGARQVLTTQYTFSTTNLIISFVEALQGEQVIIEFIKL